jgi:hypothetical protein
MYTETVVEGFDQIPQAFIDLLMERTKARWLPRFNAHLKILENSPAFCRDCFRFIKSIFNLIIGGF